MVAISKIPAGSNRKGKGNTEYSLNMKLVKPGDIKQIQISGCCRANYF